MPNQKNTKSNKPSTRRRGRGVRALPLNPRPLGNNHTVVVAYQAGKNLTEAVVGTGATQTWSLTGLFDPDITGVGAQPVGFDPWMIMYQNYLVTKVTVELTFCNTVNATARVGYLCNNANALPSSLAAWPVDPNGQFSLLGTSAGNRAVKTFRRTIRPWELLQVPQTSYMSEAEFQGSSIANPVRQLYMITWVNGFSVVGNVDTVIRISYQIQLRNPTLQSVS